MNYISEKIEASLDIHDFRSLILRLELSNTMSGFFSSGSESKPPSHGKTEVKLEVTPVDFGPLNAIEGEHHKNFLGGHYWVTTPKGECLVLHRTYGGPARRFGQYWTVDERSGGIWDRVDLAVPYFWNTMENNTTLIVPKGVLIYEGYCQAQGGLVGGGAQVFIPHSVIEALQYWQTQKRESVVKGIKGLIEAEMKWRRAQMEIIKQWHLKLLETVASNINENATRGSLFSSLSAPIQRFFRSTKNGSQSTSTDEIQQGTYKVHEQQLDLCNGRRLTATLSVRIEFVKSTTRTYKAGNTTVVETTRYYKKIYTWS